MFKAIFDFVNVNNSGIDCDSLNATHTAIGTGNSPDKSRC